MNSIASFFAGIMAFVSSLFGNTPPQPITPPPASIVQASTTQEVVQVNTGPSTPQVGNTGVILLGDNSEYKRLSKEQKIILEEYYMDFQKKNEDYPLLTKEIPIENCILKYYDAKKVVAGCLSTKGSTFLSLSERGSWKNLSENCDINLLDGYTETSSYLIGVSDDGICYYKSNDTSFTSIKDSSLPEELLSTDKNFLRLNPKNETYIKANNSTDKCIVDTNLCRMINQYNISFNEQTNSLVLGIYKRTDGDTNPKTRTIEYILH